MGFRNQCPLREGWSEEGPVEVEEEEEDMGTEPHPGAGATWNGR